MPLAPQTTMHPPMPRPDAESQHPASGPRTLVVAASLLTVVLGGLVLLVLYSLMALAARVDRYEDQLELEQYRVREYAPPLTKTRKGKSENIRVSATPDLSHGGNT